MIDESKSKTLEEKIAVWSKLTRYRQYRKLYDEARRRLAYWRLRFKRRIQCNRTWRQLEQLLALKRAISEDKKQELVESFLDACGRTVEENPHLNAPYFADKRRAEEERQAAIEAERLAVERRERRAEERAAAAEEAAKLKSERDATELSLKNKREYSVLEAYLGGGYQLSAGSLSSYQLKVRLQPHAWWSRRLFIDAETSFTRVESLTRDGVTWSQEWSSALGVRRS